MNIPPVKNILVGRLSLNAALLSSTLMIFSAPSALSQAPKNLQGSASVDAAPAGATYEAGLQEYQQGQYAKAIKTLLASLNGGKPNLIPSTYYILGCCYMQLKSMPQARQCFTLVRDRYPQSREATLAISIVGAGASGGGAPGVHLAAGMPPGSPVNGPVGQPVSTTSPQQIRRLTKSLAVPDDLAGLPAENRFYFKPGASGHMEVQAYLNDRPINCWFDTGASAHFGKNHLREAGIAEPTGPPNTSVSGWAGVSVPAWMVTWTVKLGGIKRTVLVTVEENMGLPPLLGQEFVRGYNYEIDHAAGIVTMRKELNSTSTENNLYDLPCVKQHGRDMVTIQVNGRPMSVMVDTGASRTIFDPADLSGIGIRPSDDLPTVSMQGVGGSIAMRETTMDVRLGPFGSSMPVLIGRSGGGSAIGQDAMQGHRFTIDENKHLLRFFH